MIRFRVVAVIAALLLADAAPTAAQPPISTQVLATEELAEVPAGRRWVVRPDHASGPQPHAHSAGFVFAATESIVLFQGGQQVALREGEAAWIGEGIPHVHRSSDDQPLWSFLLEPDEAATFGAPLFATRELSGFREGPHIVQLKAETFVAGGATPPHRHFGPEAVYLRDGSWELTYAGEMTSYVGGDGYLADPLIPHRLRNVGAGPGQLFNISLVPGGQPQGEVVPE